MRHPLGRVGRLPPVALLGLLKTHRPRLAVRFLADPFSSYFVAFSCLFSSAEQANKPFFVYFVTFGGW